MKETFAMPRPVISRLPRSTFQVGGLKTCLKLLLLIMS
ncbi:hypothetical protein EVA_20601 [gut metagenome]|uniref:Uncharacterized protein n=1 Tax=gut metagenome TaxID=749906 RepID=J9FNW4_9ZZZZ